MGRKATGPIKAGCAAEEKKSIKSPLVNPNPRGFFQTI